MIILHVQVTSCKAGRLSMASKTSLQTCMISFFMGYIRIFQNMFCCGQPTEMPRRSYTTLLAWTTTWERMDRGANCSRLWNISFSIIPINPNLILLLSTDMYPSSWYSCWPIKGRRAATPRVDSSKSSKEKLAGVV